MTFALPADPTDLDWMELHLRCLYHHDANDHIVRRRQPGGGPAPHFHLGRTRLGNLWRLHEDLPPTTLRALARLAGREPGRVGETTPPDRLESMRRVLASLPGKLVEWRGPAFRFPAEIEVPAGGAALIQVGPDDQELLTAPFDDLAPELAERQPCVAAVENGRVVSICFCSRPLVVDGSVPCAGTEAGVETLQELRGQGLATRVVAAWAMAVRAHGGEPLYSTSWDNRGSRAVARKLGLLQYGEDLHLSQVPTSSPTP